MPLPFPLEKLPMAVLVLLEKALEAVESKKKSIDQLTILLLM